MITYRALGHYGRFGNQLWQIASTIGIAHSKRQEFSFPQWEYQKYFVNDLPVMNPDEVSESLTGYLQDYRNFYGCMHMIDHYLNLKPLAGPLFKDRVFIHFRAYSNEGEQVNTTHPEQTFDYYKRAKAYFKGMKFVVFSDDVQKAKKVIGNKCIYYHNADPMIDFYQMTQCQAGIISNSSFSWWAGYLSKSMIVMPKEWYGKNSRYPTAGLHFPCWEIM